ncbi:DUF4184 family protein [Paenibacillus daejeonensis]|uniref:DUF4184 family protein n=1 Tax=Paenibacillus daejeonensis TaxID=135193 RepID=UPI0003716344|nr:DUF4184 family protein [Paenibacillus daejeonensis]
MPFTFAHPLYALPAKLVLRRLSLTGLVLGSMSPDFEYFLALEPYATIGHTWRGFWLQALPLSILLGLLFHQLVKRELARHLPAWQDLDRRAVQLAARGQPHGKQYLWMPFHFVAALLIGFGSHLLVDAFTHQGGYFVVRYAWLQHRVVMDYPLFKLLQHSLSLLGLIVLGLLCMRILRQTKPLHSKARVPARDKLHFGLIVTAVTVTTVLMKLFLSESNNYLGMTIVSSISGTLFGITAASLWSMIRYFSTKK